MGENNRDPSMEEILASIKRVISEEPAQRQPPTVHMRFSRAEPEEQPAKEEDVLELSNPVTPETSLLSEDAAEASRSKLAALAAMREQGVIQPSGEGPLEAVVREMLKPLLKEWLDQNLPEMVEELVMREIARITTGKDI